MKLPNFQHEKEWMAQGYALVAGLDEAGRGPLAGPVFAAAVVLDPKNLRKLRGVNDSKKLSLAARQDCFDRILRNSLDWSVASSSVEEIEVHNILQASLLAMRRALNGLDCRPDAILVDGNQDPKAGFPCKTLVGGDGLSLTIASASILAKVSRDQAMLDLHQRHPGYGFDRHKGYGTAAHLKALAKLGPCEAHRKSFLHKTRQMTLEPLT
jgi:ribonuclease HII